MDTDKHGFGDKAIWMTLLSVVILCGCHREKPVTSAPESTTPRSISVDAAAEAPSAPAPPMANAAPAEQQTDEPTGAVSLEKLNQALKQYIEISPNVPDDLAELYRARLIPAVPVPPPGKQYLVDKKKATVTLVAK